MSLDQKPKTTLKTETTYVIYEVAGDGALVPRGEITVKARTRKRDAIKQHLTESKHVNITKAVALPKADVEPIPVKASTVTVLEVG